MNPLNYATLEASKRLLYAGIVLWETDYYWYHNNFYDTYELVDVIHHYCDKKDYTPALSMAEAWRGLLSILKVGGLWYELRLTKIDDISYAGYWWSTVCLIKFQSPNPTDALIDLLIWVRSQKP